MKHVNPMLGFASLLFLSMACGQISLPLTDDQVKSGQPASLDGTRAATGESDPEVVVCETRPSGEEYPVSNQEGFIAQIKISESDRRYYAQQCAGWSQPGFIDRVVSDLRSGGLEEGEVAWEEDDWEGDESIATPPSEPKAIPGFALESIKPVQPGKPASSDPAVNEGDWEVDGGPFSVPGYDPTAELISYAKELQELCKANHGFVRK